MSKNFDAMHLESTGHPFYGFERFQDVSPEKIRKLVGINKLVRTPSFDEGNLDWELQRFKDGENDLQELKDKYGLGIPAVDIIVGEEEIDGQKKKRIFLVVDEIEGPNLQTFKPKPENTATEHSVFDTFFANLIQYYWDKYPGSFLVDTAKLEQYVYGKNKNSNEATEHIYLVDLDFVYGNENDTFGNLNEVYNNILKIESRLENLKLEQARTKMRQMFEGIESSQLKSDKSRYDYQVLKEKLGI